MRYGWVVRGLFCAVAVAAAGSALAASSQYTRHAMQVPGGLVHLEIGPDGKAYAYGRDDTHYEITLAGTILRLVPRPVKPRLRIPEGAIPDARLVMGKGDVEAAWLAEPTDRYAHGVLGDAIEAGALVVRYTDGTVGTLRLPPDAVFEDLYPRFYDLDGDGKDEIVLVRSTLAAGAGLVVIDPGAPGQGTVKPPAIKAEADPIGRPNRWLNPVGAGDVDGDGKTELLAVVTPHIGGTLVAYRMDGAKLVEAYRVPGFSNHAIGSTDLGLSTVADFDGDGIADALVPDPTMKIMVLVTFADGNPVVAEAFREPDRIAHRALIVDVDGDKVPELVYGLADGAVVVRRRAR